MKISIITISYNQKHFLKETIESVLSQRSELYQIEHVIVDPGSTDGSRELISEYGENIIKVFEKDKGPSDGLNKGFEKATGDIYYFLNSDDVLLPGALNFVYQYFTKNLNVDVLMGGGYLTDKDLNPIKRVVPTKFTINNYLYGAVSFIQQGVFFKSSAFKDVGGFNENNKTCWDGELFLSMAAKNYKFSNVIKPLAFFRLHEEGITGSGRLTDAYNEQLKSLFLQHKKRNKNGVDRLLAKFLKLKRLITNLPILVFIKFNGVSNDSY